MIEYLNYLWNNYWIIVWFSPIIWAFVLLLDVFQVNHVFQDHWDGAIISSLFLLFPGLLFFAIFAFEPASSRDTYLMIGSGALTSLAVFFYFYALDYRDDVVVADALNSIAIVLVPLFNYLIFGIDYNKYGVFAIILAFISAVLFVFEFPRIRTEALWKAFFCMMVSVFFLTISIIVSDQAYLTVSFRNGIVLFSIGSVLTGIVMWLLSPKVLIKTNQPRLSIMHMVRNNWKLFFLSELLAVTAVVFFQRAVDLGDAAVAIIIESTTPFFVMVISLFLLSTKTIAGDVLVDISKKQLKNPIIKVIASIGMISSLLLAMRFIA